MSQIIYRLTKKLPQPLGESYHYPIQHKSQNENSITHHIAQTWDTFLHDLQYHPCSILGISLSQLPHFSETVVEF